MLEQFIKKKFAAKSQALINRANDIIQEYEDEGYVLSLRQLYYQLVARDVIRNNERSYKNLGNLITDARMAGLVSWTAIEDRGRTKQGWLINTDLEDIFADLPRNYAVDMWENQAVNIEVWVEKDALTPVIERACRKFRVPYMACKGYLSASAAWRAGKRFERSDKRNLIIHLGDHDPSGLDMSRDNSDRSLMYSWSSNVTLDRIALNMDQIDQYKPPPNPTKVTDSRASGYIDQFGHTSWELDALEPRVIERMITDRIRHEIDHDQWTEDLDRERDVKGKLANVWKQVRGDFE